MKMVESSHKKKVQ